MHISDFKLGVKVTIGVCVKDSEKTIADALNSIADQDFPHDLMELIIVDDGSRDRTLSIVKNVTSSFDFHVHIISHAWKGIAYSRQIVVENASGEYLVWVDADYKLPPNFIRKHVDSIEEDPSLGGVSGNEILQGDTLVAFLESVASMPLSSDNTNVVDVGGAIYRLKAIKDIGGFDVDLKGAGEDIDLTERLKKSHWRLSKSSAKFYHRHRKTWRALWHEYLWWGYGMHYVSHKHNRRFTLTNLPPVAMIFSLKNAFKVYGKLPEKKVFLLPIHSFFKYTAWCFGFVKSHIDKNGHQHINL